MDSLQKNWRRLNLLQMKKCLGGKRYEIISYIDSDGTRKFKVILLD
jgi:hypothetical protein